MIRLIGFKLLQIKCTALVFRILTGFKIKKQPANFFFRSVYSSTLWLCDRLNAVYHCQLPGKKFNNLLSICHFAFYEKVTSRDVCITFLMLDYSPYAISPARFL